MRITKLYTLAALLFGLVAMPMGGVAQDQRTEAIRFAPGATGAEISDRITGYEMVVYSLGAEAGQRMRIGLVPTNPQTYFNVYGPGSGPGDEALAVSQSMDERVPDLNVFDAVLSSSGTYSVSVYMMRAAARRNEVSDYTLSVSITGDLAETVTGDYADGLQGGPDFYKVTTEGGDLNLRADVSTGAPVLARLPNGTTVRNLGCRMAEARRWCRVETSSGVAGWAAGDFLTEAADPNAAFAPVPACLDAVARASNNSVSELSTQFDDTGAKVMVGVGDSNAPWECTISNAGVVQQVMFVGDDSARVSPPKAVPLIGSNIDLTPFEGARAGQAEMGITALGYELVRSEGLTSYWANADTGVCARITTSNGRYSEVAMVAETNC